MLGVILVWSVAINGSQLPFEGFVHQATDVSGENDTAVRGHQTEFLAQNDTELFPLFVLRRNCFEYFTNDALCHWIFLFVSSLDDSNPK